MTKTMSVWLAGASVLCAASMPAAAQSTWNLGGSSCNPNSATPATASCTSGSVTANMSAWGNTGSGGAFVQYNLGAFDPNGFGATAPNGNETGTNWHHAFDNSTSGCGSNGTTNTGCGGSVELMLVGFNSEVNLTSVSIGAWSGDADISVYRYTGTTTPSSANTVATGIGTSSASLGSSWSLVSSQDVDALAGVDNPNVAGTDTSARRMALPTTSYSSWWVVSTYFGNATGSLDKGNDKFKLLGLAANICLGTVTNGTCRTSNVTVPEPGSLALVGLALAGIYAMRRRNPRGMQLAAA